MNTIGSNHIPSNSQTRWNFTSRIVFTVFSNRDKLIEVFDYIINHDDFEQDQQTIREAMGLKSFLTDPHFIFLLHSFKFIFEHTDVVFSILQNKSTDISYAKKRLMSLTTALQNFRNNEIYFNEIYNKLFVDFDADGPVPKKRKTTLNIQDLRLNYKQIFVEILDIIITQLQIRFSNLHKLEFFDLVKKDNFSSYSEEFPQGQFESLLKMYPVFDPTALKNEVITIYSDETLLEAYNTTAEMITFIYENDLISSLPEIYKLLTIIATIPITSCSVERSFSTLKRVKTFARNTISQDRLTNVSLISIEKHFIKNLMLQKLQIILHVKKIDDCR